MLLAIHITVALGSLLATSIAWFRPGKPKLYSAYALTGLTLASGTALVVTSPAHILQTCITGLVYTGIVSVGLAAAHGRIKQLALAPAPAQEPDTEATTPTSTNSGTNDPYQNI